MAAKAHAKEVIKEEGWNHIEWVCFESLWTAESNWRPDAFNKQKVYQIRDGKRVGLNAGGIPQKLNLKPSSSVEKQVFQKVEYIKARYGNPCKAWSHHLVHNSY